MSYRTLNSHPLNASVKTLLKRGAHIGLGIGAFTPMLAMANPTGGQVVAGQANITAQNANNLVIHQGTQSAIIDWQQFNIGAGQYVQFLQPSSSSVVLNRVVGGSPTSILGNLSANGQVFLVNSNGVYFAKGASIDAQGFLASTLDIRNSDFLNHNYSFGTPGANGATIVNEGSITAHKGGYVVLAGDYAQNTGIITAQSGHVILAAGSKATLNLSGNQLVNFAVNQATLASYVGVNNSGSLIADGGTVVMTADVANALKATVVNNSGLVEAKSMSAAGGHIYLTATGGNILNSGTINASAGKVGAKGGDIVLKGDGRTTLTETSQISAAGNGAKGGHLELSGGTLSVRGGVDLGHGGGMLLDPGVIHLVLGSIDNPGTGANTTSSGYVGVGFIQDTLNSGNSVTLSATHTIDALSSVTAIKATKSAAKGGGGELTLKVATGGTIDLHGVSINISGDFTASGSAEGAFMSFGQLAANDISIQAGSHNVQFAPATTVSGVLKPSLTATNGISITAGQISSYGGSSLNMQAGGFIAIHGDINNAGNVNLTVTNASGEGIGVGKIVSSKNVSLSAPHMFSASHALSISAAGNINIDAPIGSQGSHFNPAVILDAGKTITLDHGIFSRNGVTLSGKHLNYTGADKLLTISAGYGNLVLDAAIGSAAHHAGFGVNLDADRGYGLYIENSIYTDAKSGIVATAVHTGSGSANVGVHVGNSNSQAITLSAKGKVKLTGYRVTVGDRAPIAISADDGDVATHNDTLTISGSAGTGNAVNIGGSSAVASNHSQAKLSVDHSVSLEAGQDVVIGGPAIRIGGGAAVAVARASGGTATALTTVDITAGNDIHIVGGNHLTVRAGETVVDAVSDSKSVVSAKADASVTLSAGHDVNLSGGVVDLSAGYAYVTAFTVASHQKVTATANANLAVTAGHNITVSAGTASLQAGDSIASDALVAAGQKGAKATGTARANVSLDGGSAVVFKATVNLHVDAGYGVAGGYGSFNSGGSTFSTELDSADVEATGQNASAKLTATANVDVKAGAGGIKLTGGNIGLSAGYGLARGLGVSAGTLGGNAAADTQAHVSLNTTGAIKVKGSQVNVHAGYGDAASFLSIGVSHGTVTFSHQVRPKVRAGAGGTATLSADGSVNLNGGALSLAASNGNVNIDGGDSAGRGASASAFGAGAVASVNVNSAVNLKASSLTITATNGSVHLVAGAEAAEEAVASAGYGGAANVAADGGVHVQVQGAVKLTATGSIEVEGSDEAASEARATAVSSGAATVSGLSNVNITAGTGISMTAGTSLYITASEEAAYQGEVTATGKGATAALSGDTGVSLTAGGDIALKATGSLYLEGSEDVAESGYVYAAAGGNAKLTGLGALRIKAGGDLLASAGTGNLSIDGGEDTGYQARASASNGVATLNADAGVHIAVGGAFTGITGKKLAVFGSGYGGYGASAIAKQGGTANMKLDASVDISAKNIALTAGSVASIYGGYASVGGYTVASGSNAGAAAISTVADVSFTAAGAFTATAGTNLDVYGGGTDNAYRGGETAKHHGKAGLVTDTGVSISGDTVAFAAGGNLHIHGASYDVAYSNHAFASDFGQATVKARGAVDITAASKFSAVLTGSGSHHSLEITGGSDAAYSASASAQHHGVASILADESVNIGVTGAGGTITLSTGNKQLSAYLLVGGYDYNGYSAQANASHGGAATLTADASVNLSAKGDISIKSVHGDLSIYGGYRSNGYNASASAGGDGATAKLNVDGAVNISGANVTISAATYMELHAGYSNNGLHSSAHRGHTGSASSIDLSGGATAKNNGIASVTVDVGLNIKATGKFTGKASGMSLYGGYEDNGYGASASADHGGKATYNVVDGFTLTAGGAVSLTAVSHGLSIYGGYYYNGQSVTARADNGAVAAVNVTNRAVITAGGVFTANAAGALSIYGNNYYEVADATIAADHGAKASAVGDGSVSITGTSLSLTAGTSLRVNGGTSSNGDYAEMLASNSGSAALTALAGVKLTATTGNFTAKAGTTLRIYGGSEVAESDSLRATHHGVASLLADTGVTITGNQVNLTASGSALDISAGDDAGYNGYGSADDGGVTTETAISRVSITAKSGFTATLKGSASHGYVAVNGGEELDSGGTMHAISGAKASLNADASVNINAGTGGLTLKLGGTHTNGGGLSIYGGSDAAEDVYMTASDAAANVTTKAGVNLTAGGNISISDTTRYVRVFGGSDAAYNGSVSADGAGTKAQIAADASVNIKAGGAVSMTAGSGASIHAGNYAAYSANATADSAAVATVTGTSQVNITAGTTFTATAGDDLSIDGGASEGRAAVIEATGANAMAKVMANGSVNVKTGGAVSLAAGTGSADSLLVYGRILTGGYAVLTGASGGAATLAATSKVAITAGGALTATAGGNMYISGGDDAASHANLNGDKGTAKETADASVALTAKGGLTLTLHGHDLSINGGSVGGRHATVGGSGNGKATLAAVQSVTLSATGAFAVNGANNVNVLAGVFAATGTDAAVSGGAADSATVNSGITVKGSSITVHKTGTKTVTPVPDLVSGGLSEKGGITVIGAAHLSAGLTSFVSSELGFDPMGVGYSGMMGLSAFGSVSLTANAGLSITANTTMVVQGSSAAALSGVVEQGLTTQLITVAAPKLTPSPTLAAPASAAVFHPHASMFSRLGSDTAQIRVVTDGGICRVGAVR